MIIETRKENDAIIAFITASEASLKNSDAFKTAIIELIDQKNKQVIVSFVNVSYIDSSFLGALVSSLKYAISKQAELSIADLKKDIYALLQLTRIDKVFKIYSTTNDAVSVK